MLIVGISIAATAETFTWCMLGYRKWNAWREGKKGPVMEVLEVNGREV